MNWIERLFKRREIYTVEISIGDLVDLVLSDLLLKAERDLIEAFKTLIGGYSNEKVICLHTDTISKLVQIWLVFNLNICTVKEKVNAVVITSTDFFRFNRYVTVIKKTDTGSVLIETESHYVYVFLSQLLNTIKNIKK